MTNNRKLKHNLMALNVCIALAVFSANVLAEEVATPAAEDEYTFMDAVKDGKNLTSFRLRYETVDQDGFQPGNLLGLTGPANNPTRNEELKKAKGLTLRTLLGWQTAPYMNFSFTGQLINVTKFKDDFNDSTNNSVISGVSNQARNIEYAKIVDPSDTDINQLYVDWTGLKNTKFRLGRQAVNLDNVRFIGDIAYRQVMQVFDGASVLNKSIPDTEVFLAHFEQVKQITTKTRDEGALDIANIRYRISPTEFLVGYAYLDGFEDLGLGRAWFGNGGATPIATAAGKNGTINAEADQGNKTLGLRLDGTHPFNPNFRAHYTAEYAKQTDCSGGDSRIDAHYYKLGGGLGFDNFNMRIDQELLSSNNSKYAFQTPFGTNHLFQGWVDKFLATPVEGIRDTFVTATYRFDDFTFFADYHIFKSDEDFHTVGSGAATNGSKYGKEWNVAATWNINKNWMTKLEYGKFTEDDKYSLLPITAAAATVSATAIANANRGRVRDTDKLWLTAQFTF